MLPTAYVVLWLLAALLSVWGITLIVRGARHRRRPIAFKDVDKRQLLRTPGWLYIGVAAQGVSLALYVAGSKARAWARGELGDSIDWLDGSLTVAIGGGVLLVGVALLLRGILYDPARGRQRCPRCWYDMQSLAASGRLVCPECGHDAKHNRRLARTRRHRLSLTAGVVIMLAAWFAPRALLVPRYGYKTLVPTTVLIAGMWHWEDEWIYGPLGPIGRDNYSLHWRLFNRQCWDWQRRWAKRRCNAMLNDPTPLSRFSRAAILQYASDRTVSRPEGAYFNAARGLSSADPTERAIACQILDELNDYRWNAQMILCSPSFTERLRTISGGLHVTLQSSDPRIVLHSSLLLTYAGVHQREAIDAVLAHSAAFKTGSEMFEASLVLASAGDSHDAATSTLIGWLDSQNWNSPLEAFVYSSRRTALAGRVEEHVEAKYRFSVSYPWHESMTRAILQSKAHSKPPLSWYVTRASDRSSFLRDGAFEYIAYTADETAERAQARSLIDVGLRDPSERVWLAALFWIRDLADRDIADAANYIPAIRELEAKQGSDVLDVTRPVIAAIERMQARRQSVR